MTNTPNQLPFPWRDFTHPKYWFTWFGLALLRILHLLPLRIKQVIGSGLGTVALQLLKSRAHIARTNIDLCFPDYDKKQKQVILKAHFNSVGIGIFETAITLWDSNQEIMRLGEISGLHHLHEATTQGKGIILLTGHFTMMEIGMHMLSIHHPIGAMYRPMKNNLMNEIILRARLRRMHPLFKRKEIRSMTRSLRKAEAICYAYDQNYRGSHTQFTPFFKVPAATITTTSRFAAMGKAIVIPIFPKRLDNGQYQVTIHPPLDNFPSEDDAADTLRLNQILELAVLEAPEQYFWIHRRFKTRPPGFNHVY